MSSKKANKKKLGQTAVVTISANHALQTERIPLEIWLHIVESSDLSHADMFNLSMTSKFLGWVVQPLLFRHFTVTHSRTFTWVPGRPGGQDKRYVERLELRLQFATSTRIAGGVKSVNIAAGPRNETYALNEDVISSDTIMGKVFDAFHHFPNLKTVFVAQATLTPARVDQLASVPLLEALHVDSCTATGDLNLSRLHLLRLSLSGEMRGTFGWWLPLLRSPTLSHFSYDAPTAQAKPDDPDELVFPALATGSVMHSLTTLHLPGACYRFPCFVMALLQCPNVEELYIADSERFDASFPMIAVDRKFSLPAHALQQLRAIHAPFEFVMSCTTDRPIRHVATDLTRQFSRHQQLLDFQERFAELEELVIHVSNTSATRVHGLLRPFSRLEGLFVEIKDPLERKSHKVRWWHDIRRSAKTHASKILACIEMMTWPHTLKSLHVRCHSVTPRSYIVGGSTSVLGAAQPPSVSKEDLQQQRQRIFSSIVRQCPAIEEIHISALDDCAQWRRPYAGGLAFKVFAMIVVTSCLHIQRLCRGSNGRTTNNGDRICNYLQMKDANPSVQKQALSS